MSDKHISANTAYILKKHGITDDIKDIETFDIGPDNLSLIVRTTDDEYFIDAADYLPVDKDLMHVLAKLNAVKLELMPLTEHYGGRGTIEMFDPTMFCRVYRIMKSE
jgi:hypothetical protein